MGSDKRRLLAGELYPAGVAGVTARFAELASGLTVRVVEAGTRNAPPLVLVPGWGCTAWIFHDTLPWLASRGFHAIAVELKGHGMSDKPSSPEEYSVQSMSAHLLDIFDSLGLERPGVVGHSMGAAIAARAAAYAPERMRGLILVAPVGFDGVAGLSLFRALTPRFAEPLLPFLATRDLVRLILRAVYGSGRRASEKDVDEFHAPAATPGFTRALRNLLHKFSWNEPFPELSIPWMTILGSEDLLSPPARATRYTGIDRSVAVVIIEGAGHVIFQESPEMVNHEIAKFFGRADEPYISTEHE